MKTEEIHALSYVLIQHSSLGSQLQHETSHLLVGLFTTTLYRISVISEVLVLTGLVTPCVLTHKVWNGHKDVPRHPFESTDVPGGTTRMSFVAGVITTLKYLDLGGQIDSSWSILPPFLDTPFRVVQNHSFCVSLVHVCKYHHFPSTVGRYYTCITTIWTTSGRILPLQNPIFWGYLLLPDAKRIHPLCI